MTNSPTPPALPPDGEKKPIWTRWWMILIYVVFGIGLVGSLIQDENGDTEEAAVETSTTTSSSTSTSSVVESTTTTTSSTTTTEPQTTTTTQPPTTTTTQPTTTTTLAPVEGSGDDFIEFSVPGNEPAVLQISYSGGSNFVVQTYDSNNESLDLLVNVIGSYEGRVPVNFLIGEDVAFIEVSASGPWTITTIPLAQLPVQTGEVSGSSDDVIVMDISSPTLDISHQGESNFVVIAYAQGRDLLVNEIGSYSGTVRSPTGIVVFEINADGNWSLTDA